MAGRASDVLSVAASQLGLADGTKYGRWFVSATGAASWYAARGVAWCAMFASWCFAQAGVECVGLPDGYCPSILARARAAGATVAAEDARPGDLVLFDWDGGNPDHVGIVERNFGTHLQTIEGNVSNSVQRRTRAFSVVKACVRPAYAAEASTPAAAKLVVDGVFGELTCKALQTALQSRGYYAGCEVDGVFGPLTKRAYQQHLQARHAYLGVIDGARGPLTKKALQRALNDGRL